MFPSDRAREGTVLHRYEDLLSQDPGALGERAKGLQERRDRLEAEEAELLIEVEGLRARGRDYFRDTAAWLRQNTGIARATARTRSHVARQLAALPGARVAWSAGRIGFDHARVLADHADSPRRDNLLDQQSEIIRWAVALDAEAFRDRMADWARDLDEARDKGLSPVEGQRRHRKVMRSRTKDGLNRTVLELDEEADAAFYGALRDAAAEMQRADRKAKLPLDQQRSFRQILADAAVEVARRSRGADVITKHRARPVILALTEMSVLWDQLRVRGWCQLDDGTRLTANQIRRLACEADILPMVLNDDGVPLDFGRTVRLATYRQRLALRALHPTCAAESCDVDFDWCEIHHLHPLGAGWAHEPRQPRPALRLSPSLDPRMRWRRNRDPPRPHPPHGPLPAHPGPSTPPGPRPDHGDLAA
ncbi:MAG: DUF222 domain-containing protein [Acidimicrobiales bacterium]